jgi:hypothetical protein
MGRLPLVLAVALVGLGAFETANALWAPRRVASAADWRAAADEVRAGYRAGDLIVFAPAWVDQVGRAWLGDLVTVEMAGRADADRYGRVWEVSIRGAHADEATGTRVRETRHGRVTVALWDKPAVAVLTDFTSRADEARVTVAAPEGAETPCLRDVGAGFRCPGSRVEQRTLEIDYRPRRGLLIPLEAARATRLEWSDVELGAHLVLYAGLSDYFARKNGDGPVDVVLWIDGRERMRQRVRNDDGWRRFEVGSEPGRHLVRVEISSPQPAWRNLGLHLEARP